MELTKQVVNLELSKKLRTLDVKQESLFFYNAETMKLQQGFTAHVDNKGINHWSISAFTVAELGRLLPDNLVSSGMEQGKFNCIYGPREDADDMPDSEWENDKFYHYGYMTFTDDTEADVRAKMLIYLIENDLIKVEKDNNGN